MPSHLGGAAHPKSDLPLIAASDPKVKLHGHKKGQDGVWYQKSVTTDINDKKSYRWTKLSSLEDPLGEIYHKWAMAQRRAAKLKRQEKKEAEAKTKRPASKSPAKAKPKAKSPAKAKPASKSPAKAKPASKRPASKSPAKPKAKRPVSKSPAKAKPRTKSPAAKKAKKA